MKYLTNALTLQLRSHQTLLTMADIATINIRRYFINCETNQERLKQLKFTYFISSMLREAYAKPCHTSETEFNR